MLAPGELIKVPPPETALAYLDRIGQAPTGRPPARVIGAPETVQAGLQRSPTTTVPRR